MRRAIPCDVSRIVEQFDIVKSRGLALRLKHGEFYDSMVKKTRNRSFVFPSRSFFELHQIATQLDGRCTFSTKHAWENAQITYSIFQLFVDTLSDRTTTYWIPLGPFKFFLDIDLYRYPHLNVRIEDILGLLEDIFSQFLVCESPIQGESLSFSVFTDRIVSMEEAVDIELDVLNRVASLHRDIGIFELRNVFSLKSYSIKRTVIDPVITSMSPFPYRRAPYSLHGSTWSRRSVPNLKLSKLTRELSEFECFLFSYVNTLRM
jgi:hypothetical protein